jgi:hypothetical protein
MHGLATELSNYAGEVGIAGVIAKRGVAVWSSNSGAHLDS